MKIYNISKIFDPIKNSPKFGRRTAFSIGKIRSLMARFDLFFSPNDYYISNLKNKHKGERAFIVATGPSLRISDLDSIKNEICFGCNKIFLAFDRTSWRPTYYTVIDVLVAEQNAQIIKSLPLTKIFPEDIKNYFTESKDIIWVKHRMPLQPDAIKFSNDLLDCVYGGWTVIYTQLQLAYYMGINHLYLIGLDFFFKTPNPSGEKCIYGPVLRGKGEINHFDHRYREIDEKWSVPQLDKQYRAFSKAKKIYQKNKREILNASRESKLNLFPRVNFDSLFNFIP